MRIAAYCMTALLACCAIEAAAQQKTSPQAFPVRPVRLIVANAGGSAPDIVARMVGAKLAEWWGQQIVVDNRPGANGIIGTEAAARSMPDGYTIALIPSGHAVNASLYKKLPFDSIRDFTPITLAGSSPLVLAVHPSLPARSVKDLVALAKAKPGQLTYASAGVGASGHLAGALFESMTGTKMVHIPYKGMAVAVSDIVGGQVSMTFGTSLSVVPHVRSGRLRALATTGAQRSPALPDLATVAEAGVPGYEASLWYGFVGPARMPADIVQRLNAEIVAVLALPDIRERLTSQGVDARSTTPEAFARLLVSDVERWAKVVQRAGVRAE
jgi:tripartite-type tricarboxylate transporter receptor subunit TctC